MPSRINGGPKRKKLARNEPRKYPNLSTNRKILFFIRGMIIKEMPVIIKII